MSGWLNRIAERWMLKARAEGKLSGLKGEGKPLPDRTRDAYVDPGEAVGFRIMAEAGALPEEITLAKQIATQQSHLGTLSDPAARKAAMQVLADLQMKHAMAQEARRKFFKS